MTTRLLKIFIYSMVGPLLHGQAVKELNLSAPTPQAIPSNDQVARDRVSMTGNFRTQGSTGRFYAGTNPNMVFATEYTSNFNADQPSGSFMDYSLPVGTINGVVDVNTMTGASQYNVPIKIPMGTAGMMPNVSINYNSQTGNGILGIGWSLGAGSSIMRTGKSLDLDGVETTTLSGTDDRFALDGERLVLISGSNEAVGAQYATVLETYSRVTVKMAGDGAKYFEVMYKDGKVAEYGSIDNARRSFALCSGTVNFAYLLYKVTDVNGNFMTFTYDKNHNSVLKSIDYTGNVAAGINPYAKVSFYYEDQRIDVLPSRYYGASQVENQLLSRIVSTVNGAAYASYELSYNTSDVSRLAKITEFGIDGAKYNPTYFTWGNKGDGYLEHKTKQSMVPKIRYNIADFNGDGKSDYLYYEYKSGYTSFDLATVNFDVSATRTIPLMTNFSKIHSLDLDGDGRDELFLESFTNNIHSFTCYGFSETPLNDPIGFYRRPSDDFSVSSSESEVWFLSGDFTGDGKPDHILINNSKQILKTINFTTTTTSLPGVRHFVGRHNLNSKSDIYASNVKDDYIGIYEYNETSTALVRLQYKLNYDPEPDDIDVLLIGDFNGDGFSDIYSYRPADKSYRVNYNNNIQSCNPSGIGYNNSSAYWYVYGQLIGYYPQFELNSFRHDLMGDFNGDGIMDIAHSYVLSNYGPVPAMFNSPTPQTPDGLKISVRYGKLTGGFEDKEIYYTSAQVPNINASNKSNMFVGDFDGDNRADLFINVLDRANNSFAATCGYSGSSTSCFMEGNNNTVNYNLMLKFETDNYENLITSITNGLGAKFKFIYGSYIGNIAGWYDVNKTTVSLINVGLVCKATQQYIGADVNTTSYAYEDGFLYSIKHKKPLGFHKVSINYDAQARLINRKITRELHGNEEYLMDVKEEQGPSFNSATYIYSIDNATKKRRFLKTQERVVSVYENIDNLLTHQYDTYGNLNKSILTYKDGSTITTEYTNFVQALSWCPYLAQDVSTTTQLVGKPAYSRKSKTTYDTKGNVLSNTADPDLQSTNDPDGCKELVTTYSDFTLTGLARTVTVSSSYSGFIARVNKTQYDEQNRYVLEKTNPIGQKTKYQYDYRGNLTSETDVAGQSIKYYYDGLGRQTHVVSPLGTTTANMLVWDVRSDINSVFYKSTQAPGVPTSKVWFNAIGQEVLTERLGYSGKVYVAKKYYYGGLLKSETDPYFQGASNVLSTQYTYADSPHRVTTATKGILVSQSSYGQGSLTYINPAGQKSITLKNTLGLTASVEDNLGKKIIYDYLSNGKPSTVTVGGSVTTFEYDKLGRKKTMTDPNTGITKYTYDPLGNIVTERDARGVVYTMTYDVLGRMLTKTSLGTSIIPADQTSYVYFTSGNGINQVATITKVCNGQTSVSSNSYDNFGRISSNTETIDGNTFKTDYEYDNIGNLIRVIFPSGFSIKYVYANEGTLRQVVRGDNDAIIWSIGAENASGQITNSYHGNGMVESKGYDAHGYPSGIAHNVTYQAAKWHMRYNFDPTSGNLNWREDSQRGLRENFSYDGLNRLTNISRNNQSILSLQYEDNGNISSKSDIGMYKYDPLHINAVNRIQNLASLIPTLTQNISYNAFDRPIEVIEGIHRLTYGYDVDQERNMSKYYQNGILEKTIYYLGSYEKEVSASGVKETHYISGGTGLTALYIVQNGVGTMYYVGKDHLGSITKLYDQNVNTVAEYSYDAWGRRRNPNDWTYTGFTVSNITFRGYTGHEHMDLFGLINMNARLYDPMLGRMLSPDNYLQSPDYSQNYNRYSYAYNNPLIYTDPDGNFIAPLLLGTLFLTQPGYELQKIVSPVALHIDVHLGSHQRGIGFDVSVGAPKALPVSYRKNYGKTYYWEAIGGKDGWETRNGGEWSLNGYMFGVPMSVTYSGTSFSGFNDQTTNMITIGNPFINVSYENDTEMPFNLPGVPNHDGGDRYRTAGVKVNIGLFQIGLNLHTGMAGGDVDSPDFDGLGIKGSPSVFEGRDIDDPRQRAGILYLGFAGIRLGLDTEGIRHMFQNRMTHDRFWTQNYGNMYPWIRRIEKRPRFYVYLGSGTGNTTW